MPKKHTPEKILQGPFMDAFTHVGQLALLRRMAGSSIKGKSYWMAAVKAFRKMAEEGIVEANRRVVDPRAMVERRDLIGGLAPVRVKEQIAKSRDLLDRDRGKVEARRKKLAEAAWKLEKVIDAIIGE